MSEQKINQAGRRGFLKLVTAVTGGSSSCSSGNSGDSKSRKRDSSSEWSSQERSLQEVSRNSTVLIRNE